MAHTFLCFHWQREHFKLDWHRFNLKQKLMDKPILSEDAFEETISGTIIILCDDYQNGQNFLVSSVGIVAVPYSG